MKTKNFLFTAVLTFGAILFATNVSGQTGSVTEGTGNVEGTNTGNVQLVLKLKDFQELKVTENQTVDFTFDEITDYTGSKNIDVTVENQLTAFSTKKYKIQVKASDFKDATTTPTTLPTGVLGLFTVVATRKDDAGNPVSTGSVNLGIENADLLKDQLKTKVSTGDKIDIKYSISGSALYNALGKTVNASDGTAGDYASTVTYTILPG